MGGRRPAGLRLRSSGPHPVFHEMLLPMQLARSQDTDADLSDATTLKLGDHLASQSESECDFCAVMPANAGCCVGCGCSLAEQGHDETTMIEAPKMVESDESQEEIPAFLADAAKAMVDSQASGATASTENGSLCEALQQLVIDEGVPAPYSPGRGSAPTLPVPPDMASVTELLHRSSSPFVNQAKSNKKKREQRDGEPKEDSKKNGKKRKSASEEGGKASFKRPKKSKGARLSEASTAAPSSAPASVAEPAPEGLAMVPVPEPIPDANPSHMWMEYDLEKIGIPAEAPRSTSS